MLGSDHGRFIRHRRPFPFLGPRRRPSPWLAGTGDKDFFLGDYSALRRDYLPADYWRDAGDLPVVKLVHCEAEWDRDDQVGETAWLTHLHATTGWPSALVGHAWLDDPALDTILAGHCQSPLMRGIRSKPSPRRAPTRPLPTAPAAWPTCWRRGYARLAVLI